jgi:predicted ATPase
MIEKIVIQNFKSLGNVTLNFYKFTCFVGMNGAGKTSILQALDFLSHLLRGDVSEWLDDRGWLVGDLTYKGEDGPHFVKLGTIIIEVHYRLADDRLLRWVGTFNKSQLQLCIERASILGPEIFDLISTTDNTYTIQGTTYDSLFTYQGSILSQLKKELLPLPLQQFQQAIANIQSLELLSPNLLRRSSRAQDDNIGMGGERLSGFLDTLHVAAKDRLVQSLKKFYPAVVDYSVVTAKEGSKHLVVSEERFRLGQVTSTLFDTRAAHLNDGLLRIIAILAQLEARNIKILLLDEIEDGINPEIIEQLVDEMVSAEIQIIVTTHSPMILNYLSDEIARESVQFVYKRLDGQTKVRPFFSSADEESKLNYMGPGEAFVDTSLLELAKKFIRMDQEEELAP